MRGLSEVEFPLLFKHQSFFESQPIMRALTDRACVFDAADLPFFCFRGSIKQSRASESGAATHGA